PGGGSEVFIGPGILREVPALVPGGDRACIVGDEITAPLFAPLLAPGEGAYLLPRGEGAKTLPQVQALYDHFARSSVDRATPVAALGGGTVGDCAGFAAATWMRGVPLIQCPTTLLAMVDSAIGGKTGVNLPQGKNLVGAFHHPIAVVADVGCLQTLPAEEFRQGLAEAVKYALGEDQTLLGELEELRPPILARDPAALARLVERCVRLKLAVVAEDGDETRGIRDRLNLGHTVGHALEAASGFRWKHGDAVATGLAVALTLGERLGSCSSSFVARGRELLGALGLPRRPDLPWGELLPFLGLDKKFRCGQCRFVLPVEGARCEVRPLSLGELEEAYEETMRL
ncbi:MAG TPA: 3-dehydroquinate synthase family protein, partial [Candidatus Bipolaricaulis anaerobius]|nr:3-dehydroquinate synthase family protein [Candidatus Bipolaricaulis anaerobius]